MELSSKLADLTLVSKYHPVANYSYPRNDTSAPSSAVSSSSTGCYSDRSSLGSQASSAPGLIDDRTDSEVSVDDDYQYHAHTTELWDSFWQPAKMMDHEPNMHPKKQYPALVPSPRANRRRRHPDATEGPAAWPLPDGSPRDRSRKPAATYTPSPKISRPQGTTSPAPAPAPRRASSPKPSRPPRPPGELITPCIRVVTPCARQPAMAPATAYEHAMMTYRFPPASPTMNLPPPSPTMNWYPPSPVAQRDSGFLDEPFARPRTAAGHAYSSSAASSASTNIALEQAYQHPRPARAPRHCKSIAHLARPVPEPEPHSVFEYDSDSDSEHGRSFFRFHRRNDSDSRRSTKAPAPEALPSQARRRPRPQTAPSVPEPQGQPPSRLGKQEPPPRRKRQGHDVFGRMLGRRSR
ncbi:uncharacterized protein HRG_04373 [Hirsutella rhossiliensis]|uniref:Uncharacterized protein n=1 Tax=Hirsutella rhossiliensis TaxID=111463 RepID=A0A9P8MZ68_9HYPO|nr:uncharacterized protein HRG_04373 [Hirsutella rhossiliensis]KAH0963945.1 hypothetical protein HRG_04373 [Hirsutella rhossiliensis]